MTRKLLHLICFSLFIFLTACSVFDSEKPTSADELDGGPIAVDDTEDDFSDIEDLDVEDSGDGATASNEDDFSDIEDTPANAKNDSFNDIENFNEGLLEDELAEENIAPGTTAKERGQEPPPPPVETADAEFDVENADVGVGALPESPTEELATIEEPPAAVVADNKITNLEYKSFESGGTVVISAQNTFTYNVREEPQFNQTIIEIDNINLPERFKLPYIAKDFGQPVATINAYQDRGSNMAKIIIQYKSAMQPTIEMKNNSLMVMNKKAGADGMEVSTVAMDGSESSGSEADAGSVSGDGKPISLEMDDVEIRDVIKLIADEVNINVIIDANIKGATSVHLRAVPWEKALSSVLKSHGLGYVRQGNIMRIAPEDTLTREATSYADRLTKEEQAKKTLEPRKVRIFAINYADVDDMASKINPLLSVANAGSLAGKAIGDKRSNSIIVTDYEEVMSRVEQIIKSLDIPPLQVLLEGKIVEANESFVRDFGLQWTSNSSFDLSGKQATLSSIGGGGPSAAAASSGLSTTLSVGTFDILGDLTAILGIFERQSKVKVLSSPKVVAMNKEKSLIKAATQFPVVQSVVNNGTTTSSVTFQEANLSLEVTPQVTFNGDTILDVKVQRDVPGPVVSGISRGINKREASAKVVVRDGQTLVMGGIYNIDEAGSETGIPYLKDIPILGYLFKSKNKEITKSELVIFLTPKIINPEIIKQMAALSQKRGGDGGVPPASSGANESDEDLDKELEAL